MLLDATSAFSTYNNNHYLACCLTPLQPSKLGDETKTECLLKWAWIISRHLLMHTCHSKFISGRTSTCLNYIFRVSVSEYVCMCTPTAFSAPLIIYIICFYCSYGAILETEGWTGSIQLSIGCHWPVVRKWQKDVNTVCRKMHYKRVCLNTKYLLSIYLSNIQVKLRVVSFDIGRWMKLA